MAIKLSGKLPDLRHIEPVGQPGQGANAAAVSEVLVETTIRGTSRSIRFYLDVISGLPPPVNTRHLVPAKRLANWMSGL